MDDKHGHNTIRWSLLICFAHKQQISKYAPLKIFLVWVKDIMKTRGKPCWKCIKIDKKTQVQADDPLDSWTKGKELYMQPKKFKIRTKLSSLRKVKWISKMRWEQSGVYFCMHSDLEFASMYACGACVCACERERALMISLLDKPSTKLKQEPRNKLLTQCKTPRTGH